MSVAARRTRLAQDACSPARGPWQNAPHELQRLQAVNQELTAKNLAMRIENEELALKLDALVPRAARDLLAARAAPRMCCVRALGAGGSLAGINQAG